MSYFRNLVHAVFGLPPVEDDWWAALSTPAGDRTEGQWDDLLTAISTGQVTRYGLATISDIRLAFRMCSILPAIVGQKARAFSKGVITIWNPNTEMPVRGQFKDWEKLFLNPNPEQSQRQFFTQAYGYQQQYGWCAIDPIYPSGFNDRPMAMRVIPNWMFEPTYTAGYGKPPVAAYFNANGIREQLDVERLIIIRDTASSDIDDNGWLPRSRYAPVEAEVTNIIAGLNARNEMIADRGANGLASNAAKDSNGIIPMLPSEKAKLQMAWNGRNGGILKGQNKVIFTDSSIDYTPMTFDVNELGLHPEHIANVKAICNIAGFPFPMLAEGFEGKYNNSTNSRRDFHDTTIDPESMDFFEQLSRGLGMYRENAEAYMDYSGVASVQASQREMGIGDQAMAQACQLQWDLGIITRNDAREQMDLERLPNALFDKFKWELTPEELGAVANPNTNQNESQPTQTST